MVGVQFPSFKKLHTHCVLSRTFHPLSFPECVLCYLPPSLSFCFTGYPSPHSQLLCRVGNDYLICLLFLPPFVLPLEGGREEGREGGREGGRKGGREEEREGGREGGKEGGREGGREGRREEVRERGGVNEGMIKEGNSYNYAPSLPGSPPSSRQRASWMVEWNTPQVKGRGIYMVIQCTHTYTIQSHPVHILSSYSFT